MGLYRKIILTTLLPLLLVFGLQFNQIQNLIQEEKNHLDAIDRASVEYIEENFKRLAEKLSDTVSILSKTSDTVRALEISDNYFLHNWTGQFIGEDISFIAVTDESGVVIARGHDEYGVGETLKDLPAVKKALTGEKWRGLGHWEEAECLMASEPVFDYGGRIAGTVTAALKLDSRILERLTGSKALALQLKSASGTLLGMGIRPDDVRAFYNIPLPDFSKGSELHTLECYFYEDFESRTLLVMNNRLLIQQVVLVVVIPLLLLFIVRLFFKDLDSVNRIISSYDSKPETLKSMEEKLLKFTGSRDGNVLHLTQSLLEMIRTINDSLTQLNARNQDLKKLSRTDTLTGLANRLHLDKELNREYLKARRGGFPLSVLLFDLDHFKKLNDSFGHLEGDRILKNFSKMLRDSIRATDFAGRWGGEEFLVILPNTELTGAEILAEKCREACENAEWIPDRKVTCSIGISVLAKSDTPDTLLARADSGLYAAKDGGRNRIASVEEILIS